MTEPFKIGFCVSGQGRLMRAAVTHADSIGVTPALVVSDTNASLDVESFCADHGVHHIRLASANRQETQRELTQIFSRTDLHLISLTFDRILPPELVDLYSRRIINVHPGLLPAFPGIKPLERAVSEGARFAGVTIHEVDEMVDHGPIVSQCIISIRRNDSAHDVGRRIFPFLRLMYLQTLHWYASGRIRRDPSGNLWVEDAIYGEFPISPALELSFPD